MFLCYNQIIDKNVFEAITLYENYKNIKKEMKKILKKDHWEDQLTSSPPVRKAHKRGFLKGTFTETLFGIMK